MARYHQATCVDSSACKLGRASRLGSRDAPTKSGETPGAKARSYMGKFTLNSKGEDYVTQSRWLSSGRTPAGGRGSASRSPAPRAARSQLVPDDRDPVGHQFAAANLGWQDPLYFWLRHNASCGCRGQARGAKRNVPNACCGWHLPFDADPVLEIGEGRFAGSIPRRNDRVRAGWRVAFGL